jgi:hypothetical protein
MIKSVFKVLHFRTLHILRRVLRVVSRGTFRNSYVLSFRVVPQALVYRNAPINTTQPRPLRHDLEVRHDLVSDVGVDKKGDGSVAFYSILFSSLHSTLLLWTTIDEVIIPTHSHSSYTRSH